jgi:uncharacterized damage-inducible protein DinB
MEELNRIIDQLKRSIEGNAWHGPAVLELISDLTPDIAQKRPIENAHNIWEIANHLSAWIGAAVKMIQGETINLDPAEDWPEVKSGSQEEWNDTFNLLRSRYQNLISVLKNADDNILNRQVSGRDYSVYFLLHGVIQHSLYHAGQIAILKKYN